VAACLGDTVTTAQRGLTSCPSGFIVVRVLTKCCECMVHCLVHITGSTQAIVRSPFVAPHPATGYDVLQLLGMSVEASRRATSSTKNSPVVMSTAPNTHWGDLSPASPWPPLTCRWRRCGQALPSARDVEVNPSCTDLDRMCTSRSRSCQPAIAGIRQTVTPSAPAVDSSAMHGVCSYILIISFRLRNDLYTGRPKKSMPLPADNRRA